MFGLYSSKHICSSETMVPDGQNGSVAEGSSADNNEDTEEATNCGGVGIEGSFVSLGMFGSFEVNSSR